MTQKYIKTNDIHAEMAKTYDKVVINGKIKKQNESKMRKKAQTFQFCFLQQKKLKWRENRFIIYNKLLIKYAKTMSCK